MITTFTFVLFPLQTAGCHIGVEEKGRGGGSQTICLERIWSDFLKCNFLVPPQIPLNKNSWNVGFGIYLFNL